MEKTRKRKVTVAAKKRQRRSVDESRERILEAALVSVEKAGWSGLSFQMIAKKCKMSTSNIVYHFESRAALLKSLLEKISQNNFRIVAEAIRPEDTAFDRLKIHFQKNLEWAQTFPQEAQIVIQIYMEASHDLEFSNLFSQMVGRAQERIREHILAGMREKTFKPVMDPVVLSQILHGLLVGIFIYTMGFRRLQGFEFRPEDLETTLINLLHVDKN